MGMLALRAPPNLPKPPQEYDPAYMNQLLNILTLFFNNLNSVQQLSLAGLNLNLDTLPTDADYDTLRDGDVYRDRFDPVNGLKIKAPVSLGYHMTGVLATGAVGTVGPNISTALTGVSAAGAVGTVTP